MADLHNPHDRFFKAVFARAEVASDFLRHYLPPEIGVVLRLDTLRIEKDSFVDPELAEHYSDLLYTVILHDGTPGRVYLLFEHKSAPAPHIALDLLRCQVKIWDQTIKAGHRGPLPPILPLVLYHGISRWTIATDFAALCPAPMPLRLHVPDFRYRLIDLGTLSNSELRGQVLLHTALRVMKYIFRDELPEQMPVILSLLKDLVRQTSGLDYLYSLLRYLSRGTDKLSAAALTHAVEHTFERGSQIMNTIAAEWIKEGKLEGKLEGRLEGKLEGIPEGEAQILRRQLTRRFGPLPEWVETKLTQAPTDQLELWADRILDADTLDAVFHDHP